MKRKATNRNSVRLTIDGPKITADQFTKCVRNFFAMINDVAAGVTGHKNALEWVVSVEQGSIGICATGVPTNGDASVVSQTVSVIKDGVDKISRRQKPAKSFGDSALINLYEMGTIVGLGDTGVNSIRIGVGRRWSDISPSSVAFVDSLLGSPTRAYGTVEGQLVALELEGRLHFGIKETLTGKRVKCYFDEDLYDDVITALKQRVAAYGQISYRKGGVPGQIRIEKLTVFPEPNTLPKFADIVGLFAD